MSTGTGYFRKESGCHGALTLLPALLAGSILVLMIGGCTKSPEEEPGKSAEDGAPSHHLSRSIRPQKRSGEDLEPLALMEEGRSLLQESTDPGRAAGVLVDMARHLNKHGYHERARGVLEEAFSTADRIKDPKLKKRRISAARSEAVRAEDIAPALEFLSQPQEGPDHTVKKIKGGVLWARTPGNIERHFLLNEVLDHLMAKGEFERAERLAADIISSERTRTAMLATAMARAGDGLKGLLLLEKKGMAVKGTVEYLPKTQAEAGDFSGAMETIRKIEDKKARYVALRMAAYEQIKQDDPFGAVAAVRQELDPFPREKPRELKYGDLAPPRQYAWVAAASTYRDAAGRLAERGYADEAEELLAEAGAIMEGQPRALALKDIALARIAKGEWEKAKIAIEGAVEEAGKVSGVTRFVTYIEVGKAEAAMGDLDTAWDRVEESAVGFEMALEPMREDKRLEVEVAHVWGWIMAGDMKAGEEAMNSLFLSIDIGEKPWGRQSARRKLIDYFIQGGDIAEAVERARTGESPEERASLLVWIGKKLLDIWPPPDGSAD